jgi:predicted MFS family arabinose efflux permease
VSSDLQSVSDLATRPPSEWHGNKRVVAAAAFGCLMLPTQYVAIGSLLSYLTRQYGWSRFDILLSISISGALLLLLGPFVGRVVDRVGARPVALIGVVTFPAALALCGLTGPGVGSWIAASVVAAATSPTVSAIVWTKPIASRFRRHRGLAMGIALAGAGVASAGVPPLSAWLLLHLGWRSVFFTLGALLFVIGLPLTWLCFFDPADQRQRVGEATASASWSKAFRSVRMWQLVVASIVISGAVSTLDIHGQSIMVDRGVTPARAASAAALLGPSQIAGRLIGGWLLDTFNSPIIAAIAMLGPAIASGIYLTGFDANAWLLFAPLLVGFARGIEIDVIAYLSSRYFGLQNMALVTGLLLGCAYFSFGAVPSLIGVLRDRTGSYEAPLIATTVALVVGAILIATLGKYPPMDENR